MITKLSPEDTLLIFVINRHFAAIVLSAFNYYRFVLEHCEQHDNGQQTKSPTQNSNVLSW